MSSGKAAGTIGSAIDALAEARKGIHKPPRGHHMRAIDMPMWEAVMVMKAKDEWDEAGLEMAVTVAKMMADIKKWRAEADTADAVVYVGPNDTPKVNPIFLLIDRSTSQLIKMMRSMDLILPSDKAALAQRSKARKAARDVLREATGASLLAS
jgi:hypothetical protein